MKHPVLEMSIDINILEWLLGRSYEIPVLATSTDFNILGWGAMKPPVLETFSV